MKTRSWCKILLLATAVGGVSAARAQDKPVALANPGFEGNYGPVPTPAPTTPPVPPTVTGVTAPGWDYNSGYGNVTAIYATDTTNPHGGTACQSITVSAVRDGNLQLTQGIKLKGGSIYTVGAWFRGKPGSFAGITIQGSGPRYQQYTNSSLAVNADWQFVSAQGYVPEGDDSAIIIGVDKPGTICIDDVTVSSRPGKLKPTPVVGPIPDTFFGVHVLNYQLNRLRNARFYGPYFELGTPETPIRGSIAHDWEDNSSWADVDIAYSGDAGPVPGGGQAQTIDVKAIRSGRQQFRQTLAVRPGQDYVLTAAVRGVAGTKVQMLIQNTDAPYEAFGALDLTIPDGEWHDYSITSPVSAKGYVSLMFASDVPGRYSVGNVRLTTLDGKAAPPGITLPPPVFGTLRLWDSGTTWALIEPAKGKFQFQQLDRWIKAAKPGQDIILTLGQSPTWASSDPSIDTFYGSGATAPPANLTDWTNYIKVVAQRYKGKIKYYEVWNEPNDPTFYRGTIEQLAALTQTASAALKSVDPDAKLITAPAYSPGYLDRYLATGAAQYADIIGYHVYATPPEEAARQLGNVRLVLTKNNLLGKPLWDTEGGSGDQTTPPAQATTYMVRKFLVDLAFGARNFGWYGWAPTTAYAVGTVETNARAQTSVAKAFIVARDWLRGAAVVSADIDATSNWTIALTLADGRRGLIVWNPTADGRFTPPTGFTPTLVKTLSGTSTAIAGGPVDVTYSPILLVGS